MKCLVCHEEIRSGQTVLCGAAAIYHGPGEYDFDHIAVQNDLEGAIHLSCLNRPTAAAETPNTAIQEPVQEESSTVQRSDALTLLG